MFKVFKRRKDKPALTYSVMQRFGELVERKQRKVACYLNQQTKKFSKRKWIWLLVIFCIAFGAAATDILCDSLHSGKTRYTDKHPQNISVPAFILRKDKGVDSLEMLEQLYEHRNLIKNQKK